MTLELKVSPEAEAKIRERAAECGQDVEAFVLQAVADKLEDAELQPSDPPPNAYDWKEKLRACIELHPTATHFVDDSRESIYEGRGE